MQKWPCCEGSKLGTLYLHRGSAVWALAQVCLRVLDQHCWICLLKIPWSAKTSGQTKAENRRIPWCM